MASFLQSIIAIFIIIIFLSTSTYSAASSSSSSISSSSSSSSSSSGNKMDIKSFINLDIETRKQSVNQPGSSPQPPPSESTVPPPTPLPSAPSPPPSAPSAPSPSCTDGYSLLCAQDDPLCTAAADEVVAFGVEFQDVWTFQEVATDSTDFCKQEMFGLPFDDNGMTSRVCCVQQPQLLNPGLTTFLNADSVVVGEIKCGETKTAYMKEGNFSHWYKVEITPTGPTTLRWTTCDTVASGFFDPRITLREADDSFVAVDDDGCDSITRQADLTVSFSLPEEAGLYYVELYVFSFAPANSIYTLNMLCDVEASINGIITDNNDVEGGEEEKVEILSSRCDCKKDKIKNIVENDDSTFYLMEEKRSGKYYIKTYL